MAASAQARGPNAISRARAELRRRFKPPRKLKFTREGKYFTAMTLLIGFGAINTGNNLLYLLLGMMLALIIASGVLSESVLQKLEVRRKLPDRIFAGQPALTEITITNHKTRASSFSIQILDRIEGIPEGDRPAVYFMHVPGGGARAIAQYRFSYPRRGRWKIAGVEVATRFPFDLFLKSRDLDDPGDVVVFPKPLDPPPLLGIAARPEGDVRRHKVGRGADFHGMRDFRQGDDARDIHWKTTARRGTIIVREFEEEEARTVTLCMVNRWNPTKNEDPQTCQHLTEQAISTCAGLARDLLATGYAVSLTTLDQRISPGTGAAQWSRILRALALTPIHGEPDTDHEPPTGFIVDPRESCIVVGHGPHLPAPGAGKLLAEVSL